MGPRVAIVAAEARTALGGDLDATWAGVREGRTALAPVRGFDASGFGAPWAAQVYTEPADDEDDPALRILGRHGHLLGGVVLRTHEAGDGASLRRDRVGLFLGMGMVDARAEDLAPAVRSSRDDAGRLDLAAFFAGGYRHIHPLWPLAMLNNVAAGQISIDLDLRGEGLVVASEADGGLRALLEGMHAVADARADAVLAGGVSEIVSPASVARLALRGVLGDGPALPAARRGSGTAPGEAAAVLLLRPEGAPGTSRPLAFLRGGATGWGLAPSRPGPTAEAFRTTAARALEAAGIRARDVDAVFLHAEGRALQDADEIAGLADVAGALVATKGALGHTGPAAAALDAALAVQALTDGVLPPSRTVDPLVPGGERLTREERPETLRRVLLVAAGAHGGVGALVMEAAA